MRSLTPAERGRALVAARRRDASVRAEAAPPDGHKRDPLSNFLYADPVQTNPSGVNVTPDSALNFSAVFRAVSLLAGDVGKLPLILYEREGDDGKRRAREHPLHQVLSIRPNAWQTPAEFRRQLTGHAILRGNGLARIRPGPSGFVDELHPMVPAWLRKVDQLDTGRLIFVYQKPGEREQRLTQDEVFHLRGFSIDGIVGVGVVTLARCSIGLGIATERFGAAQFARKPMISGVLEHPGELGAEASKAVAESFRAAQSGESNWHGVAVLEENMKWKEVGMSNADAEFLSTRQFQVTEMARWFGVPPHKLYDLSESTNNNIEHQGIDYVGDGLGNWLTAWESAVSRDLILDRERYFAEFLRAALMKGDTLSRFGAYKLASGGRAWMTPDEIRAAENMNLVGGDAAVLIDPTNNFDPGADAPPQEPPSAEPPPEDPPSLAPRKPRKS